MSGKKEERREKKKKSLSFTVFAAVMNKHTQNRILKNPQPGTPPAARFRQPSPSPSSRTASESCRLFFFLNRGRPRSVAAAAAVPAAVGVSRGGLAVFGPPAEDLVGAVVAAAARHARRGLVDLEPGRRGGQESGTLSRL